MKSRLQRVKNWSKLAVETNFCVVKLAKRCEVSVRQLERFFIASTGQCPRRWLNELRLQEAPLLIADNSTVKETAYLLGYKDPSHFSHAFKKRYGMAPSDYSATANFR